MKRWALVFLVSVVVLASCLHIAPEKKYPQMVADLDPVAVGTVELELDKTFSSKLEKQTAEVLFYPRYNEVALEFRYQSILYRQFWDPEGRRLFAEALGRYKEDYAARNLGGSFTRTRAAYGKTKIRTEWETVRFSGRHYSAPTAELGYRFVGTAPYFAVTQRSAPDESGIFDESGDSLQIITYYTRAQAEEAAKLFDQSYLLSVMGGPVDTTAPQEAYQETE